MIDMMIILLGLLLGIGGAATFYLIRFWLIYRSKQKELDNLLAVVLEDAMAAEQALKIAKSIQSEGSISDKEPLDNNKYLTTLITVMVKKYGDEIRLTGYDFKSVGMDEYVTLYIDMNTHDIILRSNSGTEGLSDIPSYIMPPESDEDIFH
jgi:hypothetical protein